MVSIITSSFWIDLLLLFTPLVIYIYLKFKKRYNYFKDRNMPYYKGSSIKGLLGLNILSFKETIEDSFDNIYKKLNGYKYAGLPGFLNSNPSIIIIDPDLVEKILIKDFSHFHNRLDLGIDPEENPLEAHLFNLEGQLWRTIRAKLSPTFTSGKLKWMYSQISSCTDILLENLDGKANNEDFQIKDVISRYGLDVIASCAFGLDVKSQQNSNHEFHKMATKIFKPNRVAVIKAMVRFIFPEIGKFFGFGTNPPDVSSFFLNLTKSTLAMRKEKDIVRNDFVQLLLELKEKGSVEFEPSEADEVENTDVINEKIEFSDELLSAQSFIFFVAGFEPVSTLISFCLYEVSKKENVQVKLREEIKMVKAKYGAINYDCLKDMQYLECAMSETLRMHPPARMLFRTCTKPYKLDDGHTIEKNTIINIPTYSLQYDPRYFPDPHEFSPERFEGDGSLSLRQGRGIYIPFGDGPRFCIAKRFALLESKLALARIFEKFQLCHSPKNIEPIKRNPAAFNIDAIGGLWIRMKKLPQPDTM